MSTSLYDLTVANYLQTLGAVAGCLEKGREFCAGKGTDPNELVEARLFEDMLPLRFQVLSVAHHSLGAVEGLKAGVFSPPREAGPLDYAGLQTLMAATTAALQRFDAAEINGWQGRDMAFKMRDRVVPFTAEGFIQSFSLPNFYFHAATAYDILRMKGVPLGKRDFMGRLRLKV
jgi:uncharacterized protein